MSSSDLTPDDLQQIKKLMAAADYHDLTEVELRACDVILTQHGNGEPLNEHLAELVKRLLEFTAEA